VTADKTPHDDDALGENDALGPRIGDGVLFGERFLADHAGQVMSDARVALIELVANAYDAGASQVEIRWPSELNQEFSVEDDGTGMTPEQFRLRWQTLNYNRTQAQSRWAEVPPRSKLRKDSRLAFGQSGKGRHGAFCFADTYRISTWRDGTQITGEVRLARGGSEPFELCNFSTKAQQGHGTRISASVERKLLDEDAIALAIGSKFLVDPGFSIVLNKQALSLLSLESVDESTIEVHEWGTLKVLEVDPTASDRTTHLRGITWWIRSRMVGTPSWDGLDDSGAVLDGRNALAKRLSFVVQVDQLKPRVKADWSGFHACDEVNRVRAAVRAHVIRRLESHLAASRTTKKRQALNETATALRKLSSPAQKAVGEFTERIIRDCPSISQGDLGRAVQAFATMEESRNGFGLLVELAKCSPDDLDRWTEIMRKWSASDADAVLNELHWRLELIRDLESLTSQDHADELHELQPLFERGLWIFGPEYEAVDFRSNRSLATVVRELLGGSDQSTGTIRPDFVALPESSIGLYAADAYDDAGEVAGISRILIVELKRGGLKLTRKEVSQPEDYVSGLRSGNHVQASTRFDVFVLGSEVGNDAADARSLGPTDSPHTRIRPFTYARILKRAHARTFHLLQKLRDAFPGAQPDPDVNAVLAESATLFD
tara:strand:- start:22320 stop:24299 length:1980 start_codon:yes stop_codon:yes gene_type:complete